MCPSLIFMAMIRVQVQLMAIYEICHSKVKSQGIIYTKHRIDSPSLMLLKVHENYQPGVFKSFTSSLDAKLTKVDELYKVSTFENDRVFAKYFFSVLN